MKGTVILIGVWGFLLLIPPAFADPMVASTEKAYLLIQTISSQLNEAQQALSSRSATPAAAALAAAEEQVRIAVAYCCRTLYAAHLGAAKAALAQHNQQKALQHLLQADETLGSCAEHAPVSEPQDSQEDQDFKSALAQR